MATPLLLPVKSSSLGNSVWREINFESFHSNVTLVKSVAEVAGDKEVFARPLTDDTRLLDVRYTLPFETEKIFVNHLAFVAAIEKSAATVTAVSLEEGLESITIRLASNKSVLPVVENALRAILELLSGCAKRSAYIAIPVR